MISESRRDKLEQLQQENTQTSDRVRAIKANARKSLLAVAALTLDYTVRKSCREMLVDLANDDSENRHTTAILP